MTVFSTSLPINFFSETSLFGYSEDNITFISADATHLVFREPNGNYDVAMGSFSVSNGVLTGGTITNLFVASPEYANGTPQYTTYASVSNMSLPVSVVANANSAVELESYIFSGNDTLSGSAFGDTMIALNGNDLVQGNGGDDDINGNMGNDTVLGGDGNDMVRGGQNEDSVGGDIGNDTVNGNLGSDTVHGGDGNDSVFGGRDNDFIFGDAGNDTLSGDLGNDDLTGGDGADQFVFLLNGAQDTINDFVSGVDKIIVSSALQSTVSAVLSHVLYVEGLAVINLGQGVTVQVNNVLPGGISASDIGII